jgi:hypothetical protein
MQLRYLLVIFLLSWVFLVPLLTLPNTFKPGQCNPPWFLTTHKCHPIVASSLLLVCYFDDLKTKMFYLAHLHVFCLNTLELHLHSCSSLSQIKEEGHVRQEQLLPQSCPNPRWMGGFHRIWKCGIVTEETWIFLATEASIFHYFSSFRVGSSNWRSINPSISWRRSIKLL